MVRSPAGEVWADTEPRAVEVAGLLEHHARAVRALVPGTRSEPVTVWVQDSPRASLLFTPDPGVSSFTDSWTGRIHLNADPRTTSADLAHELVHRLLDDSWVSLPVALEEGLADIVAIRIVGEEARPLRFSRVLLALASAGADRWRLIANSDVARPGATVESVLSLVNFEPVAAMETFYADGKRLSASSGEPGKATLYGLGFVAASLLVDDIGIEGLHELCVRLKTEGKDGGRFFAGLTGLGNDPVPWKRAALARLDRKDLLAFLAGQRESWVEPAVRLSRIGYHGVPADEALDGARPRVVLMGEGFEIPLADMEGFREAFRAAWGTPKAR
jgi:hypothetical protein